MNIKWPEYDQAVFGKPLLCEVYTSGPPFFVSIDDSGAVNILNTEGDFVTDYADITAYKQDADVWAKHGKVKFVPFEEEIFEGNV